ncbi:hypothetical protein [Paracoccus sp. MC1862]|uniref:hypothetical protein n=1 Tax=Paracoccus sp. MC1862 TaxID=2760307 RepID=UPI0016024AA1|nr:hypothetical protein [Paracoccus sp. MC1862]MBB1498380.1 hypothetical protein [Paracoccus sp. MC1862]QQO44411.1 hypothetical protein JGR78_13780 [Paracoccus sp. MC1862]
MTERRDRAVVVGLVASAAWLLLVLLFWLLGPEGAPASGLVRLASLLGVVLPFALIWMAVGLAGAIADLRAEAMLLRTRLDMLRGAGQDAPARAEPEPPRMVPAPPVAARPAAAARAPAAAARPEPPRPAPPVRVSPVDLVTALNFPDGPDDHEAIAALRAALADPEAARIIRAAQDVVTLLAQHGVYTDDLPGPAASAGLWRRLMDGERGPALAALASGDDEVVEITAGLMQGDEVFRDAAQHFIRQYDKAMARVAAELEDVGLEALAVTRSGRAFGLLAQVTGRFG